MYRPGKRRRVGPYGDNTSKLCGNERQAKEEVAANVCTSTLQADRQ